MAGPSCVQVDPKPRVWESTLLRGFSRVYLQLNVVGFSEANQCLWPTQIQRVPKASDMSLKKVKGYRPAIDLRHCPHFQGILLNPNPMPTSRAPHHHHPNSPGSVSSAVKTLDVAHLAPSSWPHPQRGRWAGNVKCLLLAWQEEDRKRRRGFLCKTCKNKTYLDSSLEMCLPKYTHTGEYSDQLPYVLQEFPCRRVPACPGEYVSLSASGSLVSCWVCVCVCVCVCVLA